ncbi:aldo/keto reductase [Streptomyces sp. BBFR115]|uniref:aldo/keto reductase n=1 Tax=Streptomyces sp. BBFR115 TaxID=3448173 RepID=UPI003F769DF7
MDHRSGHRRRDCRRRAGHPSGPGIWGYPADYDTALTMLREAVDTHGISHIDTADAYGPHTVEHLIREALHSYPEHVLIATKVGMARPAPGLWAPHGHPVYLRSCVEASLRRLGVERLELCYLHRIDPQVPATDRVALRPQAAAPPEGHHPHAGHQADDPRDSRPVAYRDPRSELRVSPTMRVLGELTPTGQLRVLTSLQALAIGETAHIEEGVVRATAPPDLW